jgi:hypothetical protein
MASWNRRTRFGKAYDSTDDFMLCDSRHTAYAWYTDEKRALQDYIILGFYARDTSGATTKYHQDTASQHKVRFKVYNNGKKVYEEDLAGGKGTVETQPMLINNDGIWEVYVQSLASGDCKKPSFQTGSVFKGGKEQDQELVGWFGARPAKVEEEEEIETLDDGGTQTQPKKDNTWLYGLFGLFAIFGIKKLDSEKDK